ncbi:glycoside hydrolase, family 43 [Pseudomassariella vexata]|uniref:Arabinan endo-1,5-alpha-L-arabinosidase n=1 Tax=Pseudomassariella vexata TaxID=1141098 RepID=A0A1Y2EI60_9PEZI|nr:glycoside hydrolase, family 43 [Pseudomassariella vexata]ORY70984.1 glycoside hydrolase, family 43 [Pseudomassariella vexata]
MIFSRVFNAVLASVALLSAGVNAYADPGACSGQCWSHDPSVIQRTSDGVYFRFETGSLIGIWKSSALTGPWVYQGAAIPAGSSINLAGNDDLWAPDVQKVGSTYIMYYSVSTFGSQNSAIGYATSTTMEYGSWVDHGATGVTSTSSKNYNAIDANVIASGSSYYMNFGSFWGGIFQAPLNSAATKAASASYQLIYQPAGSHATEGSFMYYRSGYYYMFWSEGICCGYDTSKPATGAEYKIRVCRSTAVSGPFVDQTGASCLSGGGTTVLESHGTVYGPGGQGVFSDSTHGTVLYYHYADTSIGLADSQYQFGWNVITWSSGWPTV